MLYRGKDGRHGQSPGELDGVQLKGQSQTKRNKKKDENALERGGQNTISASPNKNTEVILYFYVYEREPSVSCIRTNVTKIILHIAKAHKFYVALKNLEIVFDPALAPKAFFVPIILL